MSILAALGTEAGGKMRMVVLTVENLFSNLIVERLLQEYPGQVAGIIRSTRLLNGKGLPSALLYLLRRCGLHFVFTRAVKRLQLGALAFAAHGLKRRCSFSNLRAMGSRHGVPIVDAFAVNCLETMHQLDSWQPDLVVSVYFNQRISGSLLALPSRGVINLHPALLPRYRGPMPTFWVLANGENESGATVHWVEEGYDTGPILLQEKVSILPDDTILSLSAKVAAHGAEILIKAVRLLAEGNPPNFPQDHSLASYQSLPTSADQRRFRQSNRRYGSVFTLWKKYWS